MSLAVLCLHAWTTAHMQHEQISSVPVKGSLLAARQTFDMFLPVLRYLELTFGGSDLVGKQIS